MCVKLNFGDRRWKCYRSSRELNVDIRWRFQYGGIFVNFMKRFDGNTRRIRRTGKRSSLSDVSHFTRGVAGWLSVSKSSLRDRRFLSFVFAANVHLNEWRNCTVKLSNLEQITRCRLPFVSKFILIIFVYDIVSMYVNY